MRLSGGLGPGRGLVNAATEGSNIAAADDAPAVVLVVASRATTTIDDDLFV